MKLFTTTNLVTFAVGIAAVDDVETGIQVLDECFEASLIFGGVFVALLAVLVVSLYIAMLVTEFRKARR